MTMVLGCVNDKNQTSMRCLQVKNNCLLTAIMKNNFHMKKDESEVVLFSAYGRIEIMS